MPQKIHLLNTKNRPAVGRISILAELGLRPIQAEPVHTKNSFFTYSPFVPFVSFVAKASFKSEKSEKFRETR